MNSHDLLGATTAELIASRVRQDDKEGTARFLLDRLTNEQVAAVCRAVAEHPDLGSRTLIRIPVAVGEATGLPKEMLTPERTTYWRHAPCNADVLLLANTDDDQGQSLKDVFPIGSDELAAEPELWVERAARGLALPDGQQRWWSQALRGLRQAKPLSLESFAGYVLATRRGVDEQGLGVVQALGFALPEIQAPRDSAFFNAIPEKALGHTERWRRKFQELLSKRAVYLRKTSPSHQPISSEQLRGTFGDIRDEVPPQHHPVFEDFISSEPTWNPAARKLAELEWERDKVKGLFDGLRTKPEPLGQATLTFLDENTPETLTDEDRDYLLRLDKRQTREASEEDQEFYERFRRDLSQNRVLKAKWDRFVFGQPIEAEDLLVGLLVVLERLFNQSPGTADRRSLTITSHRRTKADCLKELNCDAARFFESRYRGLKELCGRNVKWDVPHLFDFSKLVEEAVSRGNYKRNESVRRQSNQIKFTVSLETKTGDSTVSATAQLVWTFNPSSVLSEYPNDLRRIAAHPFFVGRVSRETVSAKGRLKAVDLEDVSTLSPVYGNDRGSLVPAPGRAEDVAGMFEERFANARAEHRVTPAGESAITTAWTAFRRSYERAIEDFTSGAGLASPACMSLSETYAALLEALLAHARGDRNRKDFLELLLRLGIAEVDGGEPAAIVTPWHPLRLIAIAVKARYVGGLIRHLLSTETVNFGDARVFFRDHAGELAHVFHPEVCVGMHGHEPTVLAVSQACADYSLMESPTRWKDRDATTNEDPRAAAKALVDLVRRYLDLQPHEAANMALVLYNCDTARLPEAVVGEMGRLYEDDAELRCQISLRHRRPEKLTRLYESLLETSERDPDSMVASEASRDFMARVRIGIMADQAPAPSELDGPPADIVFMQDVIARLAEVQWVEEAVSPQAATAEVLTHIPPRWSRRRPALRDDLRSTTYLACPVQPPVGWSYLRALASLALGREFPISTHLLPARQVSYQSNDVQEIFDEVHRLGHWVVNYDELLTRRQLRNLGAQVIRFRQDRYEGRNLIISSRAPRTLLDVIVQRRLTELNLGLSVNELGALASRMVTDANGISGDVVLRAAMRTCFANELIGLVLTRFLVTHEIGADQRCGWYFLDDYATWLGQKEEQIADVLALSPQVVDGSFVLVAVVTEAKYVGADGLAAERKRSATQLRQTLARMQDAIFGSPGRLDRDLWLARLSELLMEGVDVAASDGVELNRWRDAVRDGTARIVLKGYSHVFVHEAAPSDPSEMTEIAGGVANAWQEVFGRDVLRELVLAYHRGEPPEAVRSRLIDGDDPPPWSSGTGDAKCPAPRVTWSVPVPGAEQDTSGTGSANEPSSATPGQGRARKRAPSKASSVSPSAERAGEADHPPVGTETATTPSGLESSGYSSGASQFEWAPQPIRDVLTSLLPAEEERVDTPWLSETATRLRTALLNYSLQAKVVDQRLTPNAALIRFQGSDRLRVQDVESRRSQLLTTDGLRIIRVSAEPGHVVVAVARPQREIVSLPRVLSSRSVDEATARRNQSLVVGVRESDGSILYLAPGGRHAPHTLIAGTTGSGKSILLQNLILDVAMTNAPAAARITLIDPKQGVDYFALETLPHLQGGIVTEQDKAGSVLEEIVSQMDARYRMFREARASNLADFNKKVSANDRLPVLWVIHDEFAEWMLTEEYRDSVARVVQRLGVKARAAGIFLIFAAQRPEDRVLPVQLRDNLGNRLILRVESEGTSRISLGEEGAERLLGKGHLLARLQGEDDLVFAQVPILTAEGLERVVNTIGVLESGSG